MRAALARRLGTGGVSARQPPAIPDHELLRPIGSGAYGQVWLARNALGTLRAVKVVYRDQFEDERPYQREFRGILKYEPISRKHEGLMAVLHVGRNNEADCFYYVMELADDAHAQSRVRNPESADRLRGDNYTPRTLRTELNACGRLPPTKAAEVGAGLASALVYLHGHGLVHRDVKPSNVIFIGGRPKLADIGLIAGAGRSHSFVGTEGFIPPEGPGTAQADVFALGKLLYEAVTGRDRTEFPQLPAELTHSAEAQALLELNEVIIRACAPQPRWRYATPGEMLADLNLFLSGHSLRQARALERHVFWLRHLTAAACVVVALAGVTVWFARTEQHRAEQREEQSRQTALVQTALRQRAQAAEQQARRQLYSALLEQGRATLRGGEMGQRVQALEAISHAAAISNRAELRSVAFAALALPDLQFERQVRFQPDDTAAQLDPGFERLALCRGTLDVDIRSLKDDRVLASLPASSPWPAFWAEWSRDGRFLAVRRDRTGFGERSDIEAWEVATRRRALLVQDVAGGALAFHPRLPQLLAGVRHGRLGIWNLETGTQQAQFQLEREPVAASFSPSGEDFALACPQAAGWDVTLHRTSDGQRLWARPIPERVSCVAWDPKGRYVAVSDYSGVVRLLDAETGENRVLGRHKAQAVLTTFSPDGGYLLSGGWERELICWDLRTMERAFTIGLNAFTAQFSADGRHCAILSPVGAQLHTFLEPAAHREFAEDLGGRIRRAVFSPDGRWLAVPGKDRLGLWDLTGTGAAALMPEGADTRVFFSGDSQELYASRDDDCFRWRITPNSDSASPPRVQRLPLVRPDGFTSLCTAPGGIVLTGAKGSEFVPSGRIGAGLEQWAKTSDGIATVSGDGHWLAVYRSFTPWLHVYSFPEIRPVAVLTNETNIGAVEFSPVGNEVAVVSPRRVQFWSTGTWKPTRTLPGFMGILFPLDGQSWWLTKDFQHGGLFDAQTLEPVLPLPRGTLPVALSPNGRQLAVSVDARRVLLGDLAEMRANFRDLGINWETPGPGSSSDRAEIARH